MKRLDQILSNKLSQHFGIASLFKSRLPQRQIKNYLFNAHGRLIRPHFYTYDFLEFIPFYFLLAQFVSSSGPPALVVLGIASLLRNKNVIIIQSRYFVNVESTSQSPLTSRKCHSILTLFPRSPTCSVEVRGQRLYRWIFQCGCRGEFMVAIISIDGVNASLQRATVFYIYPVDPDLCKNH